MRLKKIKCRSMWLKVSDLSVCYRLAIGQELSSLTIALSIKQQGYVIVMILKVRNCTRVCAIALV